MTYEPDEPVVIHFLASDFLALMYSHSFFVTSARHNLIQTYETFQKQRLRLKKKCDCADQLDETISTTRRTFLKAMVLHHKLPTTTAIFTESGLRARHLLAAADGRKLRAQVHRSEEPDALLLLREGGLLAPRLAVALDQRALRSLRLQRQRLLHRLRRRGLGDRGLGDRRLRRRRHRAGICRSAHKPGA